MAEHELYTDADKDRPAEICDANGQVVLSLCKRCGKAEGELLDRGCDGPAEHDTAMGLPYGIIDPDYARVFTQARIIAWQYGFALAMHGSFTRDLDLLLVPWAANACNASAERVVKMIAEAADLRINGEPGVKPHGRKAWTLVFRGFADPRWVDLSVIPVPTVEAARKD